jgi:hypothetical protein
MKSIKRERSNRVRKLEALTFAAKLEENMMYNGNSSISEKTSLKTNIIPTRNLLVQTFLIPCIYESKRRFIILFTPPPLFPFRVNPFRVNPSPFHGEGDRG